ncbi:MAG: epoxyqueuosine reductase [Bacteroidota bacterium]|nr:epoxyqueuosine reductase [Bacteroidota bacterium]
MLLIYKRKMTSGYDTNKLKKEIIRKSQTLGADIVGIASVERWSEYKETAPDYFPQTIFPFTRSVIVIGTPVFLPMLESTPSIVYSELYNTSNRVLDEIAYKLAAYINRKGYRAVFFPRDGYGDISVLVDKPEAAFSHVLAGKYAGLGTIGYNHTLLTKQYGPRVRLVSVFTDAELPSDPLIDKELCVKCELCKHCCPTGAFTTRKELVALMDKKKCADYHHQLKKELHYPCGVCIKVCPVGKDRKLYGMTKKKYLNELKVLSENKNAEDYRSWVHLRSFGSK